MISFLEIILHYELVTFGKETIDKVKLELINIPDSFKKKSIQDVNINSFVVLNGRIIDISKMVQINSTIKISCKDCGFSYKRRFLNAERFKVLNF